MIVLALVLAATCGFLAGVRVARVACAHAWTLQLSRDRIWLECPLCGRASTGWTLSIAPPSPPPPIPAPRPIVVAGPWPPTIYH